jgi:hypothetical protein
MKSLLGILLCAFSLSAVADLIDVDVSPKFQFAGQGDLAVLGFELPTDITHDISLSWDPMQLTLETGFVAGNLSSVSWGAGEINIVGNSWTGISAWRVDVNETDIPVFLGSSTEDPFIAALINPAPGTLLGAVAEHQNLVVQAVPLPPAAWLFGAGMLGLIGVSRRGKDSTAV